MAARFCREPADTRIAGPDPHPQLRAWVAPGHGETIKATRRVTGPNEYTRRHKGLEGRTLLRTVSTQNPSPRPSPSKRPQAGRGRMKPAHKVAPSSPLCLRVYSLGPVTRLVALIEGGSFSGCALLSRAGGHRDSTARSAFPATGVGRPRARRDDRSRLLNLSSVNRRRAHLKLLVGAGLRAQPTGISKISAGLGAQQRARPWWPRPFRGVMTYLRRWPLPSHWPCLTR